jgi:ABC-type branched-subunit amino acid transport system substrate-binding protein
MSPGAANDRPPNTGLLGRGKYVWLLLFFLFLPIGLIACRPAPPVVKIGLVGPFEGQHRAIGYDAIYSARLAIREINQTGGNGSYRLALVALDDGGDPELAVQTAESLAIDDGVVAVIGHWLPEPTAAAEPIYRSADLPFIPAGEVPFVETEASNLPAEFLAAYAAVTPFEEVAGQYAAPAYDAFYLLFEAMEQITADGRPITRQTIDEALQNTHYEGITGEVYRP